MSLFLGLCMYYMGIWTLWLRCGTLSGELELSLEPSQEAGGVPPSDSGIRLTYIYIYICYLAYMYM